jgi:hypothetical protein
MVKKVWYSDAPSFSLTKKYLQSSVSVAPLGMVGRVFKTIVVDLSCERDDIQSKFTPNCRNEIRRAEKLGLVARSGEPSGQDIGAVKEFLTASNLGTPSGQYFSLDTSFVSSVHHQGRRLFTHVYHLAKEQRRCRLVYSTRDFSLSMADAEDDSDFVRAKGVANRYLHFQDMVSLKSKGFVAYDFGGLGDESGGDSKIKGINSFKRSFGGVEVEEFNYTPVLIGLAEKLYAKVKSRD